ncbi:MAG TPA: leucine-rich repeat domain-containing protein [Candidatus Deferrimicrobium sp.]|nr:leucine-rich repeat domain-containing protein [Candidatus Kapabacteria bacterium]HLP59832.1 leucine-rich repeat domain-containing protein [Candidatus Deferrimicrobium sp.]
MMMKKFFNSGRHGGLPLQKYKISDHPKQYRLPIGRLCRGVPPWSPVIFPKLELLPRELKGLTSVDLSGNNITDVSFVADLDHLINLNINENPVENLLPEIAKQGLGIIRDYFRSLKEKELCRLNEVKILLVGSGGAGKTSGDIKFRAIRNIRVAFFENNSAILYLQHRNCLLQVIKWKIFFQWRTDVVTNP